MKDTLRALAIISEEFREDTDTIAVLPNRESTFLNLNLDWPKNIKRVGAVKFKSTLGEGGDLRAT